ncbi:MAG: immunity 17 family protein [Tannerellaceae bacterium]|jgi:small neutral amino acid transporter SnatA (MarC family)|nr:immunity 17 family protein [Tannerellaceae bacterium]
MRTTEYLVLALFVLCGIISLAASICDADWFFHSRKASTFVQWFGRNGARIFYGLLGVLLIAAGILFALYGYPS